jgi:hypothetical protein
MLRLLQIGKLVQIAITLMVVVAIWQAFNGDVVAIVEKAFEIIQKGADVVTQLWAKINAGH